jgi:hydrogenase expression/formation protein HypC
MCLAVPGKVLSIDNAPDMPMGKVSFGGIAKNVCFAYVPEVKVGDYVIVHAGFALNQLNEEEANEVFDLLKQMGELGELEQGADALAATPPAAGAA